MPPNVTESLQLGIGDGQGIKDFTKPANEAQKVDAQNHKIAAAIASDQNDDIEKAPWSETFLGIAAYVIFFLFVSIRDCAYMTSTMGWGTGLVKHPQAKHVLTERNQSWDINIGGLPISKM